VSLTLAMPGGPSPEVKARLDGVEPGRRLTWHGNVGADWLFAGTREFLVDAQPDGTVRFTHVEDVRGVLFPLFRAVIRSAIQRHHDALNVALTKRAEDAQQAAKVVRGAPAASLLLLAQGATRSSSGARADPVLVEAVATPVEAL
jgi:hypothetical protein